MATFTLQSPGKATASHDVALETAPVADIEHDAKSIPDTAEKTMYPDTTKHDEREVLKKFAFLRAFRVLLGNIIS